MYYAARTRKPATITLLAFCFSFAWSLFPPFRAIQSKLMKT
ncbi:putative membrane protein [Vibrio harveyi]|uniref:Putative membrane protein n=1 Tax=Vibrio harveyi TaxID=669 RepID=A0A454CP50_VIBHA|nr:putative membrane protein [Vibrio harveyi]